MQPLLNNILVVKFLLVFLRKGALVIMLKRVLPIVFLMMLALSSVAFAEKGTVVYYNDISKIVVVHSFHGYNCGKLEKIEPGGRRMGEGDILEGGFHLGPRDFYDETIERNVVIRIKELWVSKERAKEWVRMQEKDSLW